MEVEWGSEFENAIKRAEREAIAGEGDAIERFAQLHRLLDSLRRLESKPSSESPKYKRVRQSRRYELWRVAHSLRLRQGQVG